MLSLLRRLQLLWVTVFLVVAPTVLVPPIILAAAVQQREEDDDVDSAEQTSQLRASLAHGRAPLLPQPKRAAVVPPLQRFALQHSSPAARASLPHLLQRTRVRLQL